ncbi:MAG: hypothetical protein MUE40_09900 [Anaerolineae bacterium]|nr:hypothetical protein [Anaerolineae bacterium]
MSSRNNESSGVFIPGLGFIVGFGLFCVAGAVLLVWLITSGGVRVLPDEASLQSRNTDTLFYLLVLIGGFVFFLVQGLLVYSVIKFRARPNDTSDGAFVEGNATLEIVWTVIPAVVVAVLAILSVVIWDTNNNVAAEENFVNGESIPINVLGQRFAWTFSYTTGQQDVNGADIVINSAHFHTYVGQHVKLTMNTADVIHSFWVPAMRIKQDVMPGRTTEVRFSPVEVGKGYEYVQIVGGAEGAAFYAEPATDSEEVAAVDAGGTLEARRLSVDESGLWTQVELADGTAAWVNTAAVGGQMNRYRIVCAELCGGGHGQMYAYLYLHENEESFLAWYNTRLEALRVPPNDPVQRGQQVLASGEYPCANCHVLTSLGWAGLTGPALNGIGDRAAARAATVGLNNGAEYLIQSIHLPNEYVVPGYPQGQMPYFGYSETAPAGQAPYTQMSEDDLTGIVAYLCAQVEGGDASTSTCGFALNADGTPVNVDEAVNFLTTIGDTYKPLYGME